MWRWIFFLIALCLAVVGVVWFVQNPGDVKLDWRGLRIETSVGVLILAGILFGGLCAITYRFWRFIRRAPRQVGLAMKNRRQRKGYEALGRGMVAVAAGDASEARKNARRADSLLEGNAPLTRLLSAQSAQLDGDEQAAERFFTDMLDDPETRFLGLRGLLTQAVKKGEKAQALELAKRAYSAEPRSDWVAATYFDLQSGEGRWIEAQKINDDMARHQLLKHDDAQRRKAVIQFEQARANGTDQKASMKALKLACDLAPNLTPAVVALAKRHDTEMKPKRAITLIEKTWTHHPHPDLVQAYWDAKKTTGGLARVKASERLASLNPDHIESHIALARASLDASLWGEARKHLMDAGAGEGLEPPARVCRMMAELEEQENQDLEKAREWLVRAGAAPADPMWVCNACGNAVHTWTAHCGNCHAFDGYRWKVPTHVPGDDDDANTETLLPAPAEPTVGSSQAVVTVSNDASVPATKPSAAPTA